MAAISRASDQIALRIPDGLRDRIKASANSNRRSMNSEIVVILEAALGSGEKESPTTAATVSGSVQQ